DFLVSHESVVDRLVPTENFFYTRCVPEVDPWGQDYQYLINPNLIAADVLAIRSAGADNSFEGETYTVGPEFDPEGDVVWANGSFVRFPVEALFADDFESGTLEEWSEASGLPVL
ncbi:MAG: hypothetical protein AAF725_27100, partial [Acidobacteriota bacterium]